MRAINRAAVMREFTGGFSVKSVFWLSALREDEMGFSRRLTEDLEACLQEVRCPFQSYDAKTPAQFEEALRMIADSAERDGMRPILHLDMHGSREHGLEIGATRERVTWPTVVALLQAINRATQNNLCVVSASCFGFNAISEISITAPSAFYLLIAPENEVTFGFLADHTVGFYRDLFVGGDVQAAFDSNLSTSMRLFNADKMLFVSLARYIYAACRGKAARQRRERLLSEIFMAGRERTPANLKAVRKMLKDGLRPAQDLLDKYVQDFLVGKKPGFTIDDLLEYVEASSGQVE
jgi:hypothetical protein